MADNPDKLALPRLVRCPRCRKSVVYDTANPFRPFCSPLCKNEDIVAWAEQSYAIPGKEAEEANDGVQIEDDDEESH